MPADLFDARLAAADPTLFATVPSQSSTGDRRSWLAVQRAVRGGGYAYLEIGSHLGGSVQQHLPDPLCRRIYSIDKRPAVQPDDRGGTYEYAGNSTARMLYHLGKVDAEALDTVTCFDADARDVPADQITDPPAMCFIDGEHTATAVAADFAFCLKVASPDAAILFHDDAVIWPAIRAALQALTADGVPHVATKLGGQTFGVFLRGCPAATDPLVLADAVDPAKVSWRLRRLRAGLGWRAGKVLATFRR